MSNDVLIVRKPRRLTWQAAVASLLVALMFALVATGPAASSADASGPRVEVFIGFDHTPGPPEHALVRAAGGEISYSYTIVPAVAALIPQHAIAGLERNARVAYIEPVIEVWAVDHGTELNNTWGVAHIGGGDAHHAGFTGEGVRVAVLDSGIHTTHTDLDYDAACSNSTSYASIADGHGHGTHVAGTVGALKNGAMVVGVAPDVTLCIHKVLSDGGGGSYSDIVASLNWITTFNSNNSANPIRVANHSYGSSGDPGTTVRNAFASSANAGVLHIAAAGNSGNPPGNGSNCIYPALYPTVMAVAATGTNDNRARFSSTCSELELSAPGVSIRSTYINGGTATMSGTSMASPHVAGVAALVFAAGDADLSTPAQVRDHLKATAKPLGSTDHYGAGLVQAYGAVTALGGSEPPATGTIAGTVTDAGGGAIAGATVSIDGTTHSAETDGDGAYKIAGVPTGTYAVSASAGGYEPGSASGVSVEADTTTTVDFALEPVDTGGDEGSGGGAGTVSVGSITHSGHGGPQSNRHLTVTVSLEDDSGNAVSGTSVSITVEREGGGSSNATASTGNDGTAMFSFNNVMGGCYTTTVTNVAHAEWDQVQTQHTACI